MNDDRAANPDRAVSPDRAANDDRAGNVRDYAVVRLHDGPGGGPVDTGITLRPGDAVTLSATGAILPGAFLGVRTSPEGWPGHPPAEDAPVPRWMDAAANAHCLVARVGDARWFATGSFHEWRTGEQEAGDVRG